MDHPDLITSISDPDTSVVDMEFVSVKQEPLDEDFTTLVDFSNRETDEFCLPDYSDTLVRGSPIKTELTEPSRTEINVEFSFNTENINQSDDFKMDEIPLSTIDRDDISEGGWVNVMQSSKPPVKRHVCIVCHKGFRQPEILSRHMLMHSDVKPYSCLICGNRFTHLKSVRLHLRKIHHNVPPFDANISKPEAIRKKPGRKKRRLINCNQPGASGSGEVTDEVGSPASQQPIESVEDSVFVPEGRRKHRMKAVETKVRPVESKDINCIVCKVSFASKVVYEDHLSTCEVNDGEDGETNESLTATTPACDLMKTHRRAQYCIKCKEFFYYAKHMEFHAENCSEYENSKLYKLEKFKNKCEICNKVYALKSLSCLKNHMVDVHGFTVGPCEITYNCNKTIDSDNLILQCKLIEKNDSKISQTDLKFVVYCITCKEVFPYEFFFKTHLDICLKNNEFVCPFCAIKIMHFNESVMNHITCHLKFKNKLFHCDLCEGSFFSGVNRHLHSINMHSAVEFEPPTNTTSSEIDNKTNDSILPVKNEIIFELNLPCDPTNNIPADIKTYVTVSTGDYNQTVGGMKTYAKKSKLIPTSQKLSQNIEISKREIVSSKKIKLIPEIDILNPVSTIKPIPVKTEVKIEIPKTIKTYVKKAKVNKNLETNTLKTNLVHLPETSNTNSIMNIELEPDTVLNSSTQLDSVLTNIPDIDSTSSTFELSTLIESCDWEPLDLKFDKYSNIGDEIQSKNKSTAPLLFTRNIYNERGAVELEETKTSQPKFRKPIKRPKTSTITTTNLPDSKSTSETTYICSTCNENIPKNEFVKHIESHVYLCTFCNQLFLERSQIKFHLELSTLECAKNYEYLLNDTKLLKQLKINFKNTHCNFSKAAYLGKITPFVAYDSANQCSVCGINYKYQCQLQRHQVFKDHDVGVIQCGICHLKFSNKAIFDNHTKLHNGEVCLECQNCNFKCKEIDDIVRHYDSEHVNEEKAVVKESSLTPIEGVYECLKCMKVFQSQLELDGHKDYDHDIFRFECRFCPAQFSKKVFLHQHLAVEHPKVKEMLGDQSI